MKSLADANINLSCVQQISSIGLPTNVKHTGHANTPEEAQKLMELLMRGDSVSGEGADGLPPPLKPSASTSSMATGTGSLVR